VGVLSDDECSVPADARLAATARDLESDSLATTFLFSMKGTVEGVRVKRLLATHWQKF